MTGERLRWETSPVLGRGEKKQDHPPQNGVVAADKYGRFWLRGLKIPRGALVVTVTRAK